MKANLKGDFIDRNNIIFIFFNRNMHLSMAEPSNYDTKSLYEEFKTYLKTPKPNNSRQLLEISYKKLYSQLKQHNQNKREKIYLNEDRDLMMKKSGCRFEKIPNQQSFTNWKETEIKQNQEFQPKHSNYAQIHNKILMEEQYHKQLSGEVDNLKASLSYMRRKLTNMKKSLKNIDTKMNKFVEVHHLADSIQQHIKHISFNNMKNYKDMLNRQEQIISNFKKIKTNMKKELQEIEAKYHIEQKQQQLKYKQLKQWKSATEEDNAPEQKHFKLPKGYRKFLDHLDKVLSLLKENQSQYQNIKQLECTRNIHKKIDFNVLPNERAQWFRFIQSFEEKFQMKLQSTQKVLLKLYHSRKQNNQLIEKRIFQLSHFYQECQNQYSMLLQKEENFYENQQQYVVQEIWRQKQGKKKRKIIQSNSKIFIQILEVLNSLVAKFRYIFKLFIVMNIDKKNYNQQLFRLDSALQAKAFDFIRMNRSSRVQVVHDETNPQELQDIFKGFFSEIDPEQIKQIVSMYFSDLRISLSCKRYLILDQLQESGCKSDWSKLVKILKSIRDQSDNYFFDKFKDLSSALKDCLKSSVKGTKYSYKREIDIPFRMFPKRKIFEQNSEPSQNLDEKVQQKWFSDFLSSEKPIEKTIAYTSQSKRNPSQVIRQLQTIRNENQKKLKVLDLGVNTNSCLFNVYKKVYQNDQQQSQPSKVFQNNNYVE